MILAASEGKVYNVSDRSIVRSVYDNTSIQQTQQFMSGHFDTINNIVFPKQFGGVFASCSNDEIRLWSPTTQKELLRVEL